MTAVTTVTLAVLGTAAALCAVRALLGKTLADRIVALDSALIMVAAGIAVHTVRIGSNAYLRLLFVTALMGFVGTVAVARFIEGRRSPSAARGGELPGTSQDEASHGSLQQTAQPAARPSPGGRR